MDIEIIWAKVMAWLKGLWAKTKAFFVKAKAWIVKLWTEVKKVRVRVIKVNGTAELFKRQDGLWSFRIVAANGQIVAVDGSQGYENKEDAVATLKKLVRGKYGAKTVETEAPKKGTRKKAKK